MGRTVIFLFACLLSAQLTAATPSRMTVPESSLIEPLGAVIIDPGHGGRDPGAVVHRQDEQITEKELNLTVALMLKNLLDEHAPHIEVHMTRVDDSYRSLAARVQQAAQVLPPEGTSKVFVSIHANAAVSPEPRGFEVWLYGGNRSAYLAPAVEDAYLRRRSEELDSAFHADMQEAADMLADKMIAALQEHLGDHTISRGIKYRDFYVIKYTQMPAVLVELGFMTNAQELELLTDPSYQHSAAQALLEALLDYAER